MALPGVTVKDMWAYFWGAVMPEGGAPPEQYREMRRAFYAGCWTMLQMCKTVGDDGISDDEGVALLGGLEGELLAFKADVVAGRK